MNDATAALLEPERAVRAGRVLRQVASSVDGGGLAVAAARVIEQDFRSTVLIVPEVFRIDIEPQRDNLGVHLRALNPHPCQWRTDPATADALDRGNPLEPLGFEGTFELPSGPLIAFIRVVVVRDDDMSAVYVSGRATVRPVAG